MKNYGRKMLDDMSYEENCALNKKLFGFKNDLTHQAHVMANSNRRIIKELKGNYPSDYVLRDIAFHEKN